MSTDQAEALRGLVEAHERRRREAEHGEPFHDAAVNGEPFNREAPGPERKASARSNGFPLAAAAHRAPPGPDNRLVQAPRLARAVAITSGKGGVGKTTVALNLAVQLAAMDQRVVLLDADLGTANVDVMCNRMPSNRLAQVIEGRATLDQVIVDAPGGFRLIPGGSGLARVANLNDDQRKRLIRQMQALEAESDILLIDTSAGVGENVLGFTLAADQVLVVTSPEPTAITDAYAVIKMICRQADAPEVRLVVNMAREEREARQVFDRIAAVCRKFLNVEPTYAGRIASDPGVVSGIRNRRPFTIEAPRSPACRDIRKLAEQLLPETSESGSNSLGLFARLASIFNRGKDESTPSSQPLNHQPI